MTAPTGAALDRIVRYVEDTRYLARESSNAFWLISFWLTERLSCNSRRADRPCLRCPAYPSKWNMLCLVVTRSQNKHGDSYSLCYEPVRYYSDVNPVLDGWGSSSSILEGISNRRSFISWRLGRFNMGELILWNPCHKLAHVLCEWYTVHNRSVEYRKFSKSYFCPRCTALLTAVMVLYNLTCSCGNGQWMSSFIFIL